MDGIIIKAISSFYYVETDAGIIECKARGRFKERGTTLLVGDRVKVLVSGEKGVIEEVTPRKNCLLRTPVANNDMLFIVSSSVTPTPNTLIIDRMTAICEYNNIEPIIIFNKNDLEDVSHWCGIYDRAGFKTVACSAVSLEGVDKIKAELKDCVSAFTGNSGAGKSSLLNIIFPKLNLSVGEVSDKLGRGRHTTRHTELFSHEFGGYVADTPGFSSLEADKGDFKFKEMLPQLFPEFEPFECGCSFSDCKHIGEKGCAVCEAVKKGDIEKTRYSSYLAMFDELKDLKIWNAKK
ncbi:MAG: ribosome small subunit-dependent GTPase A [Clostridia bacterium]|nr:ribosome small subunit-dependent GTPase A [Clostridia bacterium]